VKTRIRAILEKINEDAERHGALRYAQIKDAVDKEVDAANALYREESEKQREILKKHHEHEYARRLERQRSRLNRELLTYQQELIDEIFDAAAVKLRDSSADEYSKIFKTAVKGLSGSYTLHLGALSEGRLETRAIEDATEANRGLKIVLSNERIPHKSGFTLSSDKVEYDCLFEDLVEDLKSERAAAVMKEVFGDSGDWMLK